MSDPLFAPRGVVVTAPSLADALDSTVDKRLAQFAYKTPRFPNAIRARDLQNETLQVQLETAQVWFWANLEPYYTAGPPAAIGPGPHRGVPWGYPVVTATGAISQAFGPVLSLEARETLAESLQGSWMWRENQPPLDNPSAILARLDALAAEVRQLATRHGQKGHNSGAWYPEEAQREALEVIAETKLAVRANAEDRTPISEDTKSRFTRLVETLVRYSMVLLINVVGPVLIGAETETGKLLAHVVVGWFDGQSIAETLKHWH